MLQVQPNPNAAHIDNHRRTLVWENTQNIIKGNQGLQKIQTKRVAYNSHSAVTPPQQNLPATTIISVVSNDCLYAAHNLLVEDSKRTGKVAVLDMANAKYPGGNYKHGARAQEEDLVRRTNLAHAFQQHGQNYDRNNFGEFDCLYVADATILKHGEDKEYGFIGTTNQKKVNVIVSAAYDLNTTHSGHAAKDRNYETNTKKKIRQQFRAAVANNQTCLVLGAFGCGAFKNDPAEIARFYREVLSEQEFNNAFEKIVFAVLPDGKANTNLNAFRAEFNIPNNRNQNVPPAQPPQPPVQPLNNPPAPAPQQNSPAIPPVPTPPPGNNAPAPRQPAPAPQNNREDEAPQQPAVGAEIPARAVTDQELSAKEIEIKTIFNISDDEDANTFSLKVDNNKKQIIIEKTDAVPGQQNPKQFVLDMAHNRICSTETSNEVADYEKMIKAIVGPNGQGGPIYFIKGEGAELAKMQQALQNVNRELNVNIQVVGSAAEAQRQPLPQQPVNPLLDLPDIDPTPSANTGSPPLPS